MAGLLDYLFDPSTYNGDAGLLSRISPSLFQIPQGQGFAPQQRNIGNQRVAPIAIGQDYVMPRVGRQAAFTPDQASQVLPPQVANAQAQAPQAETSGPNPTFLSQTGDRLGAGFQNFVNAGSPLQALGGLITGFATGNRTDPIGIQQQNLNAQFQATRDALIANGISPRQAASTAMLSVLNPEAAKTVLPELLTSKEKFQKIGSNPVTGDQFGFVNEREQTVNGKPLSAGGAGTGSQMLAPGVGNYDPNLTGEAYLNQFSPEVKAAVKAYINGDVMPTGNPRQTGIANAAKTIAQKYGADMGLEVNDRTYGQKRQMQTDLAKSTPNSAGGILANGKSAFQHLSEASDRMVKTGNYSGPNIPGGATLGAIGNFAKNSAFSTPQNTANLAGESDNLLKYGQEGTKFYAGTGGGEAERMFALKHFDPASASSLTKAEFLETEKQLMLDRFRTKENQVREQLGQDYLDRHPVITADVNAAIKKIDDNIAKLRAGEFGQQTPAAPKAAPKAGTIQGGYRFKGGDPGNKANWEPIS